MLISAEKGHEIWLPIKDYGGAYDVSSKGRIRSYKTATGHPRILKLDRAHSYATIHLLKNKHVQTLMVHRIVAKTFIPNPMHLSQVDHIDGNRTNNSILNLRWVTGKQNNNFKLHRQRVRRASEISRPITLTKGNQNLHFNSLTNASKWLYKQTHKVLPNLMSMVSRISYSCMNKNPSYTVFGYHPHYTKSLPRQKYKVSVRLIKGEWVRTFPSTKSTAQYLKSKLGLPSTLKTIESDISYAYLHGLDYYGYTPKYITGKKHNKLILKAINQRLRNKYGENFVILARKKHGIHYRLKVEYLPKKLVFTIAQSEAFRKRRKSILPQHHDKIILTKDGKSKRFKSGSAAARYVHKLCPNTSAHALATEIRATKGSSNRHNVHGFNVSTY